MSNFDCSKYKAAVVVTSDACSSDESKDTSGQYVVDKLTAYDFMKVTKLIVSDDKEKIKQSILELVKDKNNLVITVGGTGLCPRDVTPDVTASLYEKECQSIATSLIANSLSFTPHAALSRLTSGIIGSTLIVNFPGKLKACKECFRCLDKFLKHALEQVVFNAESIKATHLIQEQMNKRKVCFGDKTEAQSIQESSSYPMIPFDEALKLLGKYSLIIETENIPLTDQESSFNVLGRTLAEEAYVKYHEIPECDVSTMDGYVVHIPVNFSGSFGPDNEIEVVSKTVYELWVSENVNKLYAYRVNTGHAVPDKDFAIVPVEDTIRIDENRIKIMKMNIGKYIRRKGSDLNFNDELVKGTIIGPVELGIILSMELPEIKTFKVPTVGILSTGDELIDPFIRKSTGVVDVNRPILSCLMKKEGFQVADCGFVSDGKFLIAAKISTIKCDVLIITGGASMGTQDFVKEVLKESGFTIHFGRVNMKPGKPVAFASINSGNRKKYVFSLPGNPVSAYVTCLTLVIPFIRHSLKYNLSSEISPLQLDNCGYFMITVKIEEIVDGSVYEFEDRYEFLRAKILRKDHSNGYQVKVSVKQQSSRLLNLRDCDCLVMVQPDLSCLKLQIGQIYPALKLKD